MTNVVFSEDGMKNVEQSAQQGLKTLLLYMVHDPCHGSQQTTAETETLGLSRMPHPS
jgi:hypothetical protein